MNFIYCSNPLSISSPDFDYEQEYLCAKEQGHSVALFSYEDMADGRLKMRGELSEGSTIYRGWMMPPSMYAAFYESLIERGVELINSPEEYNRYHMLPLWYEDFKEYTPKSLWTECLTDDSIRKLLCNMIGSVIVKDFVKSRKHEWFESCFIPDVKDEKHALSVIHRFIDRQGENLTGGLVLREFVDLRSIGEHPDSHMPISEEYRIFFLNGKPLIMDSYWHHGEGTITDKEWQWISSLGEKLESHFVTMDLARMQDGTLMIMELGDGQVSGLQEIPEKSFYEAFRLEQGFTYK